jgi:hypothetical protein
VFPTNYWVQGVALSPDGAYLATGNCDGTVHVHRVPKELPALEVCEVRPTEKGPKAPNLGKAERLYLDTFNDPESGWGRAKGEFDYVGGKYVADREPGRNFFWHRAPLYQDFACEVVGRVKRGPSGWWGVYIEEERTERGVRLCVNGKGQWKMLPGDDEPDPNRGPYGGPFAHPAIKKGAELNRLLMVLRGRRLEMYVNGQAVCEPVTLDRDVTPGHLGLWALAEDERTITELERFTVWSARAAP